MKNIYLITLLFSVLCISVKAQPGDDMESYTGIVCGNQWVEPCGILVTEGTAHSGVKSGYIDGSGTVDGYYTMYTRIIDIWHLSFWGYIPEGSSGYFSVLEALPPNTSLCSEIYFNRDNTSPGTGEVVGAFSSTFSFPHNQWFFIEMTWDISMGLSLADWCMNVNGVTIVPPETPYVDPNGETAASLGGLNFFSAHPTNNFYIDDFTFEGATGSCILTGVDSQKMIEFSATPNPVLDILRIEASDEISAITIYNLLGEQVFHRLNNASTAEIDMSNYTKGVYFVKIDVGDSHGIVKIIR